MTTKSTQSDDWRKRLSRQREIHLTVTGRRSGRDITIPVWFVVEGSNLELLPVTGSDTQWYKNVLSKPAIRVEAGGQRAELRVVPITDRKQVSSVTEKFREKYGAADVKKYYSKFDVAVVGPLTGSEAHSKP